MSARLVILARWAALVVLALAVLLMIARWRLPMREHRGRSTLDLLRGLWARWRERREDAQARTQDLRALSGTKALLVGPEDKGIRVMRWKLDGLRCAVLRARSGTQGIALARQESPDVIVVDALLSDMPAAHFFESLEGFTGPVAFLRVVGHQWDECELGRNVICAGQPFDPEEVAAAVGYVLRRSGEDKGASSQG